MLLYIIAYFRYFSSGFVSKNDIFASDYIYFLLSANGIIALKTEKE